MQDVRSFALTHPKRPNNQERGSYMANESFAVYPYLTLPYDFSHVQPQKEYAGSKGSHIEGL